MNTTTISSSEEGDEPPNYRQAPSKNSAKLQGHAPAGDKPAEAKAEPFTLGEGLPMLLAKVVAKILRGEYVEMVELLQDNIALDNKLATAYSEGVSTGHLK